MIFTLSIGLHQQSPFAFAKQRRLPKRANSMRSFEWRPSWTLLKLLDKARATGEDKSAAQRRIFNRGLSRIELYPGLRKVSYPMKGKQLPAGEAANSTRFFTVREDYQRADRLRLPGESDSFLLRRIFLIGLWSDDELAKQLEIWRVTE